jgi:hypothetical protein
METWGLPVFTSSFFTPLILSSQLRGQKPCKILEDFPSRFRVLFRPLSVLNLQQNPNFNQLTWEPLLEGFWKNNFFVWKFRSKGCKLNSGRVVDCNGKSSIVYKWNMINLEWLINIGVLWVTSHPNNNCSMHHLDWTPHQRIYSEIISYIANKNENQI